MTEASKKNVVFLGWVFCIYYPVWFKKFEIQVQALIDFENKVNAMTLRYVLKLSLKVCLNNVKECKKLITLLSKCLD